MLCPRHLTPFFSRNKQPACLIALGKKNISALVLLLNRLRIYKESSKQTNCKMRNTLFMIFWNSNEIFFFLFFFFKIKWHNIPLIVSKWNIKCILTPIIFCYLELPIYRFRFMLNFEGTVNLFIKTALISKALYLENLFMITMVT